MTTTPSESAAHRRGRRVAMVVYYTVTVGFIVMASGNVLLQAFGRGPTFSPPLGEGHP